MKSKKLVDSATTKGEPTKKDLITQEGTMIDKDSQVKLSPSKLDILAFAIDVSLLDIVEPLRETTYPRIYVVEKLIVAQPVSEEVVAEHSMVQGGGEK